MVAVALFALGLGGVLRFSAGVGRARRYENQRRLYRLLAETIRGARVLAKWSLASGEFGVGQSLFTHGGVRISDPRKLEAMAVGFDHTAAEREEMRRRCLRAAYCVWETLPPPPPPF
jgi:hypothetical protein